MESLSIPGLVLITALILIFAVGEYLRSDGWKLRHKEEHKKEHNSLVFQMWFGFGIMTVTSYGLMDMGLYTQSIALTIAGGIALLYTAFRLLTRFPRFTQD